jgi:recombination protein RecR
MKYPKSVDQLISAFRQLPGVGAKTAERFSLHIVNHFEKEAMDQFKDAIDAIQTTIFHCPICGNITDINPCLICQDTKRDQHMIMVVEEAKDLMAVESSQTYHGLYHVLGGVLSPADGVGPEQLTIKSLLERLKSETIKEVILATNLNAKGEMTAAYLLTLLQGTDLTISRIAHGLPAGGHLEFADDLTLSKALEGRTKLTKS